MRCPPCFFTAVCSCLVFAACSGGGSSPLGTSSGAATGTSGSTAGTTAAAAGSGTSGHGSGGSTTASVSTSGAVPCGGVAQDCCAGGVCDGSPVCSASGCTQPAAGVAGTPCAKNSDCPTGICLPVHQPPGGQPTGEATWTGNVCTTTCASPDSCVAGWTCAALLGQTSDVCQCSYAPEVCDGKDNDCDGIVDDEPKVDQVCQEELGEGRVCSDGYCVCGSGLTRCGAGTGQCLDTATDTSDCGACGTICANGASCVSGACQCPAGQEVCAGSCTDLGTDVADCGTCGHACASGASCESGECLCPTEQTVCSASCTDVDLDPSNCGACGTACPGYAAGCDGGQCLCGAPPGSACVSNSDCCSELCNCAAFCNESGCYADVDGYSCYGLCDCQGFDSACTSDFECCSGVCKNGACTLSSRCWQPGVTCTDGIQCCTGFCDPNTGSCD